MKIPRRGSLPLRTSLSSERLEWKDLFLEGSVTCAEEEKKGELDRPKVSFNISLLGVDGNSGGGEPGRVIDQESIHVQFKGLTRSLPLADRTKRS